MAASHSSQTDLFSRILTPLQSVVNFFSPPCSTARPMALRASAPIDTQARLAQSRILPIHQRFAARTRTEPASIRLISSSLMGHIDRTTHPHPLSATQSLRSRRGQDNRIVISGRMRDVCAELDRLCENPAS
jgi:hypothetical protein